MERWLIILVRKREQRVEGAVMQRERWEVLRQGEAGLWWVGGELGHLRRGPVGSAEVTTEES